MSSISRMHHVVSLDSICKSIVVHDDLVLLIEHFHDSRTVGSAHCNLTVLQMRMCTVAVTSVTPEEYCGPDKLDWTWPTVVIAVVDNLHVNSKQWGLQPTMRPAASPLFSTATVRSRGTQLPRNRWRPVRIEPAYTLEN